MRLTPPKQVTFYISVALAIISVVLRAMAITDIRPLPTGGYVVLLVAYLVLLASVTLKGV
jgi:hypothetical protein